MTLANRRKTFWGVLAVLVVASIVAQYREDMQARYAKGCYAGLKLARADDPKLNDMCALKAGYNVYRDAD